MINSKKDIEKYIQNNHLKIIIRPNSPKTEITDFDKNKQALRVNVKALPEKGKANQAIIKFFSKLLKRKISIISGLKSKEKILLISCD